MKILQVISHYLPAVSFGGPLQVAHGLGKALVDQGHEVTVCCTNMKDSTKTLDVPVNQPIYLDGVKVIYHSTWGSRYWGFSPELVKSILRESKKSDVILTHFHYQFSSVIGGWCARFRNKPYVVFTHGSLNKNGIEARHHTIKKLYMKCVEYKNFKTANFTAYHSDFEKEQSLSFGGRTSIVPIGVDSELIHYVSKPGSFRKKYSNLQDKFVFAYLGRLSYGKGLDLFLSAFHTVLAQGHNVALVFIGGDERGYAETLKNQIQALNLEERIIFTGVLTGPSKFDALVDSDVFVLPSRSEGTSISTMEAMALSLPVIVTDRVGLSREIAQKNCGLVIPYSEKALADAMLRMINSNSREAMGKNGSEHVRKNYDWNNIARNLTDELGLMQKERGKGC